MCRDRGGKGGVSSKDDVDVGDREGMIVGCLFGSGEFDIV